MYDFDCYQLSCFLRTLHLLTVLTLHSIALHRMLIFSSAYNSLGTDAPESEVGLIEEVPDDAVEPELQEHQGKQLSILILSCLLW